MNDEAIHIPARKKQQTGAQMAVKVTPEAYNALVEIYNVVELTAENDAGNIAYCTKMLLIVDPATLCVRLVPLDYMVEVVPEDYKITVIPEDYAVEAVPEQYQVIAEPDPLFVEVIYPIHGRGGCCEQN